MRKIFFSGTHRVVRPEETYAAIMPLFGAYGITRVCDVTGLDVFGIPVAMAVRPLATTLSVSQGKGATVLLAKISAAMEAVELWHAENAVPAPVIRATPARALDLPYRMGDLPQTEGSLVSHRVPLDWITATPVTGGTPVPVPRQAVELCALPRHWTVPGLSATSNGLASGNTVGEALVHALYEVIERDALAQAQARPHERRFIHPASVDDPSCADFVGRILDAGAWLELELLPSPAGVPCIAAFLWHEDLPRVVFTGSGAHCDPAIALSRAVTEAAQSRLTAITGTRDDLALGILHGHRDGEPRTGRLDLTWSQACSEGAGPSLLDDGAEADWLAARVRALTGVEPLYVLLAERAEFAVVKVLSPGLGFSGRHSGPSEDGNRTREARA